MQIIAFIKEQSVITRILDHVSEPSIAPILSPARGPPADDSIEQMDLFENAVDEIPGDEMDQTVASKFQIFLLESICFSVWIWLGSVSPIQWVIFEKVSLIFL